MFIRIWSIVKWIGFQVIQISMFRYNNQYKHEEFK
jgi:hypothetical protein